MKGETGKRTHRENLRLASSFNFIPSQHEHSVSRIGHDWALTEDMSGDNFLFAHEQSVGLHF